MNELPPDPPRLRAILAHLDRQIADTDTVATYLRLQRSAVLAAISDTDRTRRATTPPAATSHPAATFAPSPPSSQSSQSSQSPQSAPKRPPAPVRREAGSRRPTRFLVERPASATKPAPIHTSGCGKGFTGSKPIDAGLARHVLVNDPRGFAACPTCRPDTELGIDVA
ncbi:DUF6233 domain-containing protein [Streptomyces sp. NPDC051014]|uniref:DUF6233 domain-containing protein n=1 Tax=Streptomyces sp. NPDC051014 TaxID=3155751 RepID=UPI0033FC5012